MEEFMIFYFNIYWTNMHMRVPSIEKHKNYRRLSAVLSKEFLQGSEK